MDIDKALILTMVLMAISVHNRTRALERKYEGTHFGFSAKDKKEYEALVLEFDVLKTRLRAACNDK